MNKNTNKDNQQELTDCLDTMTNKVNKACTKLEQYIDNNYENGVKSKAIINFRMSGTILRQYNGFATKIGGVDDIEQFPKGVTTIGNDVFRDCKKLTSITIPEGVTKIGGSVFENCSALISIIIPNSVTTIGDLAFLNCSKLTSIIIPNSVTTIGYKAFLNCTKLTIYIPSNSNEQLMNAVKSKGVNDNNIIKIPM